VEPDETWQNLWAALANAARWPVPARTLFQRVEISNAGPLLAHRVHSQLSAILRLT
jgi:hypothetical protein